MGAQQTPIDVPLTGGCQCGAIRYAIAAPPERVHLCHCTKCQRAVGGPFAALAPVKAESLTWTKGKPAEFKSSHVAARGFCSACGTPLSFRYLNSDWIDVTIGSLDEPAAVRPTLNYGAESMLPWFGELHAMPCQETETGGLTGKEKVP